jgi:hypothetical protein
VTEETPKITEVSIFLIPAIRYSKILNMDLQSYSEEFMTETQNGFWKGCSCTNPTFCLKLLIEKRTEYNLETHLLLIGYEKAFDSV